MHQGKKDKVTGSVNPIHNNKLILLLVENMAAVMTSGPEMKSTDPA